jgi:uncharacterized membrane protein YoaK (UPF0700 family)
MWKAPTVDSILPYSLLGMTVVTGLIDAVSYLSLGHVFTANMTGNIVLLAFASTGVPQVSLARSITALLGFLAGAAAGGRIMTGASSVAQLRAASSVFALEVVFLVGATLAALGYTVVSSRHFLQPYAMIIFTAIAMGMRNAAIRKLALPDLTTTVLTLTVTGLAADSSLARGTNPRWQRRIAAVVAMFTGAALGSIILRHSVFVALAFSVVLSSLCSLALLISSRLSVERNAEKD